MGKRVDWSDLPKELWPLIAKHLNATIDVLRFRSVCKTWRSSLPLHHSQSLFAPQLRIPHAKFSILQTKIYRLQPSLSPSSSNSKGWIIKVGESKSIPLRLLNPLTNFRYSPNSFPPKVVNLLNFKVVELIQAYTLNRTTPLFYEDEAERDFYMTDPIIDFDMPDHPIDFDMPDPPIDFDMPDPTIDFDMPNLTIRKVMLFPNFHVEGCRVFALYRDGQLGVSKIGDENWNILDDGNQFYDDMILHKGQLYAVDKWGTLFWIDCSNLKLVQFSPFLYGFGKRKHLVECGGSLYVVDLYIEEEPDNPKGVYCEVIGIKVYKLDEESGWLDVKNLGDVLFVLGEDSNFSLSAQDYCGCEGNSIYFHASGRDWCFSLENSEFKSPNTFWPCPTLFHPNFNL